MKTIDRRNFLSVACAMPLIGIGVPRASTSGPHWRDVSPNEFVKWLQTSVPFTVSYPEFGMGPARIVKARWTAGGWYDGKSSPERPRFFPAICMNCYSNNGPRGEIVAAFIDVCLVVPNSFLYQQCCLTENRMFAKLTTGTVVAYFAKAFVDKTNNLTWWIDPSPKTPTPMEKA